MKMWQKHQIEWKRCTYFIDLDVIENAQKRGRVNTTKKSKYKTELATVELSLDLFSLYLSKQRVPQEKQTAQSKEQQSVKTQPNTLSHSSQYSMHASNPQFPSLSRKLMLQSLNLFQRAAASTACITHFTANLQPSSGRSSKDFFIAAVSTAAGWGGFLLCGCCNFLRSSRRLMTQGH